MANKEELPKAGAYRLKLGKTHRGAEPGEVVQLSGTQAVAWRDKFEPAHPAPLAPPEKKTDDKKTDDKK